MKIRTGKVHTYGLESTEANKANKARDGFSIIWDLILLDIMHSQCLYGFQLYTDNYIKHRMLSWQVITEILYIIYIIIVI